MLKNLIPPFLYSLYHEVRRKYGYFGEYKSWTEAKSNCTGYDSALIAEKIKNSALKVKSGEVAYERDSVLFPEIEMFWHILAPLLWIASKNNNSLKVLDFGGSLGTTYYQNRRFLQHTNLSWTIIEQKKLAEYGQKYFEDESLKFYKDLEEYSDTPNVIILSSVIQYLESPYQMLDKLTKIGAQYILFDKTPFLDGSKDALTVQKVPPHIYEASYPSWVFGIDKFLDFMAGKKYNLLYNMSSQKIDMFRIKKQLVNWKSFLFEKI